MDSAAAWERHGTTPAAAAFGMAALLRVCLPSTPLCCAAGGGVLPAWYRRCRCCGGGGGGGGNSGAVPGFVGTAALDGVEGPPAWAARHCMLVWCRRRDSCTCKVDINLVAAMNLASCDALRRRACQLHANLSKVFSRKKIRCNTPLHHIGETFGVHTYA